MAVDVRVVLPGVSPEHFDRVRAEVGWIERPPDGGYSHLAWWEENDCHNIDAWESELALNACTTDRLGPALGKLGIEAEPEVAFYPAHEVYTPRSVAVT